MNLIKPSDRKSVLKKSAVFKKMRKYREAMKNGEYGLQMIELNYDNRCNFNCEHCFSRNLTETTQRKLNIEDVRKISEQAHELGVWQWHLQGGEPLIWKNLDKLVGAIDPELFHIFITTNGSMMTPAKAQELADIGVDKISISLDSFDPGEHDKFRRSEGSYDQVIKALFLARDAGLQVNVNTVITHQNVRSQEVLDIITFAEDNDFTLLFVVATASGHWAGQTDMLVTEDDAQYIENLKVEHPLVHRDLYPLFDFDFGCRTMNGLVYITENGELLSCPFIHISMGNVLDEPLKDILERGWRVKHFRDYNGKCLAGEDLEFIDKYMPSDPKMKGVKKYDEVFSEEDFYDE